MAAWLSRIDRKIWNSTLFCGVVFIHLLFGSVSAAQDVTLTSRDQSVEITGALVGYDGEFYRVDTVYGVLTVDGSGVLCNGPGCPDLSAYVAKIRISGAATISEKLLPALVSAFANQREYQVERIKTDEEHFSLSLRDNETLREAAVFSFRITNSDEGFADLLAEEADIAVSLREVTSSELALANDAGLGQLGSLAQSRVIALDALVPIVSHFNPVRELSPTDLYEVFTGGIDNWQTFGGIDAPIELHLGADSSGVAQRFISHMAQEGFETLGNVTRHGSNQNLVDAVSSNPFAIGVSVLSDHGNTRRLTMTGSCGFKSNAVAETLRTEDYPLTAPMFVYVPSRRLPKIAREFLRFSRSPAAQIVVQTSGFSGQALSEIPLSRQGRRLANAIQSAGKEVKLVDLQNMVSTLKDARRLSLSYRFAGGSSVLDAQSRSNIVLVARALEAGSFDGKELIFAGFSDGDGAARANVRLSQKRAKSVLTAVMREAATADATRIQVNSVGFGEVMPMACDDTDWGRNINRRVELWVR